MRPAGERELRRTCPSRSQVSQGLPIQFFGVAFGGNFIPAIRMQQVACYFLDAKSRQWFIRCSPEKAGVDYPMHYSVRFPKTVVLLVLTILASQSILFAQSQTLYLPVLQATDAANLGLALSNPTLSATAVTLTA